jgi:putative oxidoreductase
MTSGGKAMQSLIALVGRIFLAAYFAVQGVNNAIKFHDHVNSMSGMPYPEGILVLLTILQFLGALLILFGWFTRIGGFILLIAVIITTWIAVYVSPVAPDVLTAFNMFFVHLALAGATFYLMAFGAGYVGLDALRSRSKK